MAIQLVTEEVIFRMAREAKRHTGAPYLCMAGGVALNCVANGKLRRAGVFDDLWIQPAAGDAGGGPWERPFRPTISTLPRTAGWIRERSGWKDPFWARILHLKR
jgi:hypothetical protein